MSAPRGRRMSSACTTNNGIGHKSKERSLDKYLQYMYLQVYNILEV